MNADQTEGRVENKEPDSSEHSFLSDLRSSAFICGSRVLSMPIELTQPWYLLGLLVLPVVGWYFYRGLTDFSRWQRIASLTARTLVIVLLVGALCGLTWLKPSKDVYVVYVIDDSLSVGDESKYEVDKFIERSMAAAGKNKVAFLRFGTEPGAVVNEVKAAVLQTEDAATLQL